MASTSIDTRVPVSVVQALRTPAHPVMIEDEHQAFALILGPEGTLEAVTVRPSYRYHYKSAELLASAILEVMQAHQTAAARKTLDKFNSPHSTETWVATVEPSAVSTPSLPIFDEDPDVVYQRFSNFLDDAIEAFDSVDESAQSLTCAGSSAGVAVELDATGNLTVLTLDRDWYLEQNQNSLGEHIEAAYAKARANMGSLGSPLLQDVRHRARDSRSLASHIGITY